ncbi:hypothetical protein CBR_g32350 [Chara braunii]|uniref:AB hydrolase-1 domain-containing protein n=1 Tax=Chara braunii TaxID=69332 RepID=A0A388JNI5_CHABU|nr:hypothetical protein CBR_g32350 [Chara braunii]|eukprot:GBG59338.1 hypothetical protein CBR_g32350 [Chara braunii]
MADKATKEDGMATMEEDGITETEEEDGTMGMAEIREDGITLMEVIRTMEEGTGVTMGMGEDGTTEEDGITEEAVGSEEDLSATIADKSGTSHERVMARVGGNLCHHSAAVTLRSESEGSSGADHKGRNQTLPTAVVRCGICLLVLIALRAIILQILYPVPPTSTNGSGIAEPLMPALHVTLQDGRRIAYKEWGVPKARALFHFVVVHGLVSSRLAGMPGVKAGLLEEFHIRMISYDRPGFGQSDPQPQRTLRTGAEDMAALADALELGDKFWILSYSGGGPHAWAAARFIPHRIAGLVLCAPMGNPFWPNFSPEELRNIRKTLLLNKRVLLWMSRRVPWAVAPALDWFVMPNFLRLAIDSLRQRVGHLDRIFIDANADNILTDLREAVQQNSVRPIAEELILYSRDWGFSLETLNSSITRVLCVSTPILSKADADMQTADKKMGLPQSSPSSCSSSSLSFCPHSNHVEVPLHQDEVVDKDDHDQDRVGRQCAPHWQVETGEVRVLQDAGRKASEMQESSGHTFPVHVFHGTDDRHVPYDYSAYIKRTLPAVQLHTLEGHGHFSWFCDCDVCQRQMLNNVLGASARC